MRSNIFFLFSNAHTLTIVTYKIKIAWNSQKIYESLRENKYDLSSVKTKTEVNRCLKVKKSIKRKQIRVTKSYFVKNRTLRMYTAKQC